MSVDSVFGFVLETYKTCIQNLPPWQISLLCILVILKKVYDDRKQYTGGGNDAPYIFNTEVLTKLQWPANKSIQARLHTFLKLVEEFDAATVNNPSKFLMADKVKFFAYWDTLLDNSVKITVRNLASGGGSAKGLRNSYAHCNFYSLSHVWSDNTQNYDKLLKYLTVTEQDQVEKQAKSDWVLWNIHDNHNQLKFCFIIKNEEFRRIFDEFEERCNQTIIDKNKYDPREVLFNESKFCYDKIMWTIVVSLFADYVRSLFSSSWFIRIVIPISIISFIVIYHCIYPWISKLFGLIKLKYVRSKFKTN